MASEYGVDILGGIPLDIRIREDADGGRPTVVADPDGAVAGNYRSIARQVAGRLAARKRNYSEVFPSIVVQNTGAFCYRPKAWRASQTVGLEGWRSRA